MKSRLLVASILLLATATRRTGGNLAVAADHHRRADHGGRPARHHRAHPQRADAAVLGQPVIVENVTGAGGSLGVQRVARAAPDGYTVSIGHLNSHVFTGAVYNLNFDLLKDLAPVTLLTAAPMVFVARSGLPANSLKELVAWMKEHPKGISLGSVGIGGPAKVWATDFQNKIGIEFQFVPYRGAAAIVQDLIAGQIDVAAVEASNVVSQLNGGKLKPFAVLSQAALVGRTRKSRASTRPARRASI